MLQCVSKLLAGMQLFKPKYHAFEAFCHLVIILSFMVPFRLRAIVQRIFTNKLMEHIMTLFYKFKYECKP